MGQVTVVQWAVTDGLVMAAIAGHCGPFNADGSGLEVCDYLRRQFVVCGVLGHWKAYAAGQSRVTLPVDRSDVIVAANRNDTLQDLVGDDCWHLLPTAGPCHVQ